MCGEYRLAFEFHALRLRIGAAARCTLGDAAALQLRSDAKHGSTSPAKSEWYPRRHRKRTQARLGALHVAGDREKVGGVAREAVNRWDHNNIAVRKGGHQLFKLQPVGGRPGDLLAQHFFATGRLELGKLAGEVLASVETRA
jgi:hypothetical protein